MTARDKGHIEEIIKHLQFVEKQCGITLSEEINWLRELPERMNSDEWKQWEMKAAISALGGLSANNSDRSRFPVNNAISYAESLIDYYKTKK